MDSHVVYRAEIYQENDQYVALCPEWDVSSFSDTPEEAKQALKEAVEAFLEELPCNIRCGIKYVKCSWGFGCFLYTTYDSL